LRVPRRLYGHSADPERAVWHWEIEAVGNYPASANFVAYRQSNGS